MAEGAAGAIAPSLEHIAAAEARAAETYWDSVEAQCKADAVPIPKLSERAEAAVAALAVAPDDMARAALWRSATAVVALGPELRRSRMPCSSDWERRPCSPQSAGPSTLSRRRNAPTPTRSSLKGLLSVGNSG